MSDVQKTHTSKHLGVLIVALLVVGGCAFYGGVAYAKHSVSAARQAAFGGAGGQNRGTFAGGGAGRNMGGLTTGEILSKDDKSLTIKLRDGGSKVVFYSDSTKVGKSVTGTSADLVSGQQVTVIGTANSDGTLTAQTVDIRPAMMVPVPAKP